MQQLIIAENRSLKLTITEPFVTCPFKR